MNKDKLGKALAAGAGAAAAAAVAATTVAATKKMRRQQEEEIENAVQNRDYGDKQVYFVGGGIASLAGAAYLVRDANFKGKNIHILEGMISSAGVMMVSARQKKALYAAAGEC